MEQESSYLQRLIKARNDLAKERDVAENKRQAIIDVARNTGRDVLNDDEDREFREFIKEIKRLDDDIKKHDGLIAELDEEQQRKSDLRAGAALAERAKSKLESITEQATYTKGSQRSFFKDLADIALGRDLSGEAQERLRRHQQDVRTLPEYTEQRTGLDTSEGDGGSFTPPAYLLDQYITYARPGRPFADIIVNEAVPPGTMQVNVPKITTGTAVNWQSSQNTALGETDLTDTYVTGNVCTIGGNQTVSRQLLDQAGLPIDSIVFRDLVAAHAQFLDTSLWTGSGSGGQVTGVTNIDGIQTVATGGLTINYVYASVANAIQSIWTSRFAAPDAILMHPRRWGWFLSLLDSNDRPLFLPESNGPFNVAGLFDRVAPEAVVGRMHNLPVITDPNLPTDLGSGSNEDAIFVVKSSDIVLFETGVRAEAFREPLAAQLSVLLQVSSYIAFISRYPNSIVEISGFTPPTWGS